MSWFRLRTLDEQTGVAMRRTSHREIHTTSGTPLPEGTLHEVFEVELLVDEDYGTDQYDPFFEGELVELSLAERLGDYYDLACVMTPALVAALRAAGADNLEVRPARVVDPASGDPIEQEYHYVHIVGLVACADPAGSSSEALGSSRAFTRLRIDPDRVGELRIFRLAESPWEVIVDEAIAEAIRSGGFRGVGLEEVG